FGVNKETCGTRFFMIQAFKTSGILLQSRKDWLTYISFLTVSIPYASRYIFTVWLQEYLDTATCLAFFCISFNFCSSERIFWIVIARPSESLGSTRYPL